MLTEWGKVCTEAMNVRLTGCPVVALILAAPHGIVVR
jgi:hypothetical protein